MNERINNISSVMEEPVFVFEDHLYRKKDDFLLLARSKIPSSVRGTYRRRDSFLQVFRGSKKLPVISFATSQLARALRALRAFTLGMITVTRQPHKSRFCAQLRNPQHNFNHPLVFRSVSRKCIPWTKTTLLSATILLFLMQDDYDIQNCFGLVLSHCHFSFNRQIF